MMPLIWNVQKKKISEDQKQISGRQGLGQNGRQRGVQDLCGQVGGIEDFTSLLNVTETPTHNGKVLFYVNGTSEKPLLKKKKKT